MVDTYALSTHPPLTQLFPFMSSQIPTVQQLTAPRPGVNVQMYEQLVSSPDFERLCPGLAFQSTKNRTRRGAAYADFCCGTYDLGLINIGNENAFCNGMTPNGLLVSFPLLIDFPGLGVCNLGPHILFLKPNQSFAVQFCLYIWQIVFNFVEIYAEKVVAARKQRSRGASLLLVQLRRVRNHENAWMATFQY
ncbi:hypothetical protein Hypma_002507 [Hypsizygus marmoreus]|uniref:Uncharacterized protein n=1 Tax=Hypsizygus marmoreus TaxID=39966 RepID=A0A369J6T6_HYPMA|nr:hypothetical protein Hypma_002507 [Hypsizygus marmoreus]